MKHQKEGQKEKVNIVKSKHVRVNANLALSADLGTVLRLIFCDAAA